MDMSRILWWVGMYDHVTKSIIHKLSFYLLLTPTILLIEYNKRVPIKMAWLCPTLHWLKVLIEDAIGTGCLNLCDLVKSLFKIIITTKHPLRPLFASDILTSGEG